MPLLTHGPLVGATTDSTVSIWLRADGEGEAEVRLAPSADSLNDNSAVRATAVLKKEDDFTGTLSFSDLSPDTAYHYTVLLDGQAALGAEFEGQASFRTFPAREAQAESFAFAFGSCFIPELHTDEIFNDLVSAEGESDARFFLMIGDNVYVDNYIDRRNQTAAPPAESLLALYREAYRESWKYPIFRRALMQTPSFMIFDDHEFWNNWHNSAVHQHDREGFPAAIQSYREYQDSHNPDAGQRHAREEPAYHYMFSYGEDVGFFVLDCRIRRNPDAIPFPTILGDEQRQALYQWLRDNNNRYRLKFIVSSVPISFITLPHKIVQLLHGVLGDQWLGYPEERLELFKFIQHEGIEGVHFLSGDIHLGQGLVIEADEAKPGPTIYSYTSSPLANAFHLFPEQTPAWFSIAFWIVAGLILGWLAARYLLDVSPGWGLLAGLLGGAVAAWLWIRWRQRRELQPKVKSGRIEDLLFRMLRWMAQQRYMRKLMGVADDTIKGGSVHYVPDNLFTAVQDYNMGIVTVTRTSQDGPLTVQFKLVNAQGETLAEEPDGHSVA
jgi:phosphodiesterase/alkaline phosphatase D-like protein